jgi:hypothetical protein
LEPLPTGAWAFLAVTTTIFTKTLSFSEAFTAFQNDVIWLIVVSFFFAAVIVFSPFFTNADIWKLSHSSWHELEQWEHTYYKAPAFPTLCMQHILKCNT